jgi:hypothetical protein
MNKLEIAKTVVSTIVGVGTAKIVGSIIGNNTSPETVIDKMTITAGTFVLGSMVADITKRYTDAKIDQIAAFVEEARQK